MVNSQCPCGSKIKYKNCCQAFHLGKTPKNALELMKARYCAYALSIEKYIIKTTHKDNPDFQDDTVSWTQSIKKFSKQTRFEKLEILDFQSGEEEAYVTFKVTLHSKGVDTSFSEKSKFRKTKGFWYYLKGEINPSSNM